MCIRVYLFWEFWYARLFERSCLFCSVLLVWVMKEHFICSVLLVWVMKDHFICSVILVWVMKEYNDEPITFNYIDGGYSMWKNIKKNIEFRVMVECWSPSTSSAFFQQVGRGHSVRCPLLQSLHVSWWFQLQDYDISPSEEYNHHVAVLHFHAPWRWSPQPLQSFHASLLKWHSACEGSCRLLPFPLVSFSRDFWLKYNSAIDIFIVEEYHPYQWKLKSHLLH